MTKEAPLIGTDGLPLPVMPPDRDPRLSIRVIRVMFYTPGFLALLLLKAGEPTGFGLTVELLMLASASAVVAGLFIATQSSGGNADAPAKVGLWSGALVLELLGVVPFLCAVPPLFHQLAHSELIKALAPGSAPGALGPFELIPAGAIIPFMVYQLAGFGTLNYVISKPINWGLNIAVFVLIIAGYIANREARFEIELGAAATLVTLMAVTVIYGILKLKAMQTAYDAHRPPKHKHEPDAPPAAP